MLFYLRTGALNLCLPRRKTVCARVWFCVRWKHQATPMSKKPGNPCVGALNLFLHVCMFPLGPSFQTWIWCGTLEKVRCGVAGSRLWTCSYLLWLIWRRFAVCPDNAGTCTVLQLHLHRQLRSNYIFLMFVILIVANVGHGDRFSMIDPKQMILPLINVCCVSNIQPQTIKISFGFSWRCTMAPSTGQFARFFDFEFFKWTCATRFSLSIHCYNRPQKM